MELNEKTPFDKLGDFEVLRELGRGGMGIVYEARQVSLNRKVALKVLSGGLGLTGQAVIRFRREAAAAAKLHHTNIVPIYATGESDGMHYYAMELIEGPSLDKVIKQMRARQGSRVERKDRRPDAARRERSRRGEVAAQFQISNLASEIPSAPPNTGADDGTDELAATVMESRRSTLDARLSTASVSETTTSLGSGSGCFDTVARMMAEVADALDYAHKQGVIHRDIKPSNLLLSQSTTCPLSGGVRGGLAGRLSINDFGLARVLEEPGMTITGEFLGSPSYMSPEQITAGRIPLDHRTDIFSLGVVLYELLTFQPPFTGSSRDQILAQIVQKEPKPPRSLNRNTPVDLETICLTAMEKDPDRRYQSGSAMAEDLRRFVNRFAISARRAGLIQRTVKWARRRPAIAASVAVSIGAILLAGLFGFQAALSQRQLKAEQGRNAVEMALLAAMSGDLDATEAAVRQAELMGASVREVRMLRGQIALHRGKPEEAIVHLQQAVELAPNSAAARAMLMMAHSDAGHIEVIDKMFADLEQLPLITPEDSLFKGQTEAWWDPDRGLQTLNEAIRLRNSVIARTIRAGLRASYATLTGNPEDALQAIADANIASGMQPDNLYVRAAGLHCHTVAAPVATELV